ncbi:PD-(D/E)XK nuclease family protein, partial [Elusimicrobiota bacterium]
MNCKYNCNTDFIKSDPPAWSWSSSRASVFNECKRKYLYNYYLSHKGWLQNAPIYHKQAYRLKKLTNLHLLLGTVVHQAAEYVVTSLKKDKAIPDINVLFDNNIRKSFFDAYNNSRILWDGEKRAQWEDGLLRNQMILQEYYYGAGNSYEQVRSSLKDQIGMRIKIKREKCMGNLLGSHTVDEIKKNENCSIDVLEDMDTFDFQGTPVYAIPDLVFRKENGTCTVVDWKTGKEDSAHINQISVYCIYMREKKHIDEESLVGRLEYLLSGRFKDVRIT